jgi:hypothetical protein
MVCTGNGRRTRSAIRVCLEIRSKEGVGMDDKIFCHICGTEITDPAYIVYWCGGQGNVLRPVCKDKDSCLDRLLNPSKELVHA